MTKPYLLKPVTLVAPPLNTPSLMALVASQAANAQIVFISQTEWLIITIIGLAIIVVIWVVILRFKRHQIAENRGYLILYNHEFTKNPEAESAYGKAFELANQTKRHHTWELPGSEGISRIEIEQSTEDAEAKPLHAHLDFYLKPNDFRIKDHIIKEGRKTRVRGYYITILSELGQPGWEWTKNIEIDNPAPTPANQSLARPKDEMPKNTEIDNRAPIPADQPPARPKDEMPEEICGGKYKVGEPLGEGGYGKVYLVEHKELELERVAKRLSQTDELSKERFLREAKAQSKLDHKHIVPVHEFYVDQSHGIEKHYIIMPHAPHGSLKDLMEKRRHQLPIEEVIEIGKQLASALIHIHEKNIIHRDIKPGNILVFKNNDIHVKLSDFGIALFLNEPDITREGERAPSTPPYAAPEQREGKATFQSDIYSLGATLYDLVTWKTGALFNYVNTDYDDLISPSNYRNDMLRWLENIIVKSLSKKPSKRYQSAEGLLKDLSRGDTGSDRNPTEGTE